MNKNFWEASFRKAFPIFLALAMAGLFFVCILYFGNIKSTFFILIDILTPFIYGGVMAYLLKTPCNFLERTYAGWLPEKHKKKAEGLAVLSVIFLSLFLIYFLLSLVIPELVNSISTLVRQAPAQTDHFTVWITSLLEGNPAIQNYVNTTLESLETTIVNWAKSTLLPNLQDVMGQFASTVGSVVGVLYNIVIGVIICVYLLLGKRTFARQGKSFLHALFKNETAEQILKELRFIDKTFVGFFGGKILDSAIVGVICYIFCLIMALTMGFKNSVLISVIVGVTNIIPYFGPYIGGIPSALLVLMDSPRNCLIFVIFVVILQQFDGNFLGPHILSDSVGLSGFWVLFSITFFGGIFGFAGILVGVPVFAVIYDLCRRWVRKRLKRNGYEEEQEDGAPSEPEDKDIKVASQTAETVKLTKTSAEESAGEK